MGEDPDLCTFRKESAVLIAKATELFIEYM
jgi:hypothetical protein